MPRECSHLLCRNFGTVAFGRYVPPITFVREKHLPCDIALCLDNLDVAARMQFDQLATATSCPVHLPINNEASDSTGSCADRVVDLSMALLGTGMFQFCRLQIRPCTDFDISSCFR